MKLEQVINSSRYRVSLPESLGDRSYRVTALLVHANISGNPERATSRSVVVNLWCDVDGNNAPVTLQMEAGDALDLAKKIEDAVKNSDAR